MSFIALIMYAAGNLIDRFTQKQKTKEAHT